MTTSRYDGYESYSYLTPGKDFQEFELVPEIGRVPAYELDLSQAERDRAEKLLADNVVISLHEHPHVFPQDMSRLRDYIRTGRERTGYRGLAQSGMTAVFDNMMDGMACVTSNFGWKWDDVIYDIGMRLSDLAHQDFVTV
ncbi:MAG: Zn-dependent dipeptidase microsomal dipeptidase, partial [Modestobacter sp.]|nr:Zn-dependent dipeptidase microsomal dipeptidase [Modestobacter sp.]